MKENERKKQARTAKIKPAIQLGLRLVAADLARMEAFRIEEEHETLAECLRLLIQR